MHEAKVLYMLDTLKTYDVRSTVFHPFIMTGMTNLTSFFCFASFLSPLVFLL